MLRDSQAVLGPVFGACGRSTANTAVNGAACDLQGFEGLTILLVAGTLVDADATFAVKVQERDTSSGTWTDVADNDLRRNGLSSGQEADVSFDYDADDSVGKIGYVGTQRYVRAVVTPAGNAGNADIAIVYVRTNPRSARV